MLLEHGHQEDGVAGPLSETTSVAAAACRQRCRGPPGDADCGAGSRRSNGAAESRRRQHRLRRRQPAPRRAPAVEQVPLRASSARISEVLNSMR